MSLLSRVTRQFQSLRSPEALRQSFIATRTDLTYPETECILKYVDMFPAPIYVEIGVYFGGTFARVLDFLKKHKTSYQAFGIDLFEGLLEESSDRSLQTHEINNKWNVLNVARRSELDQKLKQRGFANYQLLQGPSHEVVAQLPVQADVFFIDGNHTYIQTKLDAEACLTKAKAGSYLIFHNASRDLTADPQYVQSDGGPWQVCEELKTSPRLTFIELTDRCAVFRVK